MKLHNEIEWYLIGSAVTSGCFTLFHGIGSQYMCLFGLIYAIYVLSILSYNKVFHISNSDSVDVDDDYIKSIPQYIEK